MTLGSDFSGGEDLDPAMREVSGRRALAQSIVRRLTTGTGNLQDYPAYGFNVTELIGTSLTNTRIRQSVLGQVLQEEEVEYATVNVRRTQESVTIDIVVTDGDGPFDLTLNISGVEVEAIIPANI